MIYKPKARPAIGSEELNRFVFHWYNAVARDLEDEKYQNEYLSLSWKQYTHRVSQGLNYAFD